MSPYVLFTNFKVTNHVSDRPSFNDYLPSSNDKEDDEVNFGWKYSIIRINYHLQFDKMEILHLKS